MGGKGLGPSGSYPRATFNLILVAGWGRAKDNRRKRDVLNQVMAG